MFIEGLKTVYLLIYLFIYRVNGGSPSPLHESTAGNYETTNDQFESWDDEISTQTSPNSLRPIGAEHKATSISGVVGHNTGWSS